MVAYRSLRVVTPPAVEPVTLTMAKLHCRVDTTDDDAYITNLIVAAREWCESFTGMTFVHAELAIRFDSLPEFFTLPRPPMAADNTATPVSITLTALDGVTSVVSTATYRVDRFSKPGVVRLANAKAWPSHSADFNAVEARWWAGYSADASAVPQRVKNAMLMLIAWWYERRMAADQAGLVEVPMGVKDLLGTVKWSFY